MKKDKKDKNDKEDIKKQLIKAGYTEEWIRMISSVLPSGFTVNEFRAKYEQLNAEAKSVKIKEKEQVNQKKEDKENKDNNNKDNKQKKGGKEKYYGYRLQPDIDGNKDANGNMFLCIGPKKEKVSLKEYTYCKCWVPLKQKLKKKGKKPLFHYAVMIDLRETKTMNVRDIERQKLKMGYDNVVSFKCNVCFYNI